MIVWKLDLVLRTRGIKGRELARKMEIGENYLSRVRHEVPDRLSLSLLDALCRELDCGLSDLLEYRPDETQVTALPQPKPSAPEKKKSVPATPEPVVVPAALEKDVPAAVLPQPKPPEPVASEEASPTPGGAVLRVGALQARLERLKRSRRAE